MPLRYALICLLVLVLARGANADLTLTLDQTQVSALPGDMLTFTGNLQNTSSADIYLNGAGFPQLDIGLAGDESPFFANTPPFLTPGQSLPGSVSLFTVTLDSSLPSGVYSGTFQVVGGPDDMTFNPLASADFQINIAPSGQPPAVPEPGGVSLLIGMATVGGILRKRRNC